MHLHLIRLNDHATPATQATASMQELTEGAALGERPPSGRSLVNFCFAWLFGLEPLLSTLETEAPLPARAPTDRRRIH